MELIEKVITKLVDSGPMGLCLAILLVIIALMAAMARRLYDDNQAGHLACTNDAKEYARGLAAGIATLDAAQALVRELVVKKRN